MMVIVQFHQAGNRQGRGLGKGEEGGGGGVWGSSDLRSEIWQQERDGVRLSSGAS